MKKLITIPLLVVLGLTPGCSSVQTARDELASMSEADYQSLRLDVSSVARQAGEKLAALLGDDSSIATAQLVTSNLKNAVMMDRLDVNDIVRGILDQYSVQLGLSDGELEAIRDAAKVIDAAVGQIRLGIDGRLSEREKDLLIALLDGVHSGLS